MPYPGQRIGAQEPHPEHRAAQQPKIGRPAHQKETRSVQPDLSAPGPLGPDEQGQRHPQPERQIQQSAQRRHRQAPTQDPQQVVHQPRRRSQRQSLDQSLALLGHRDRHPRSSRAKKPLPPPASSS